MNSCKMKVHDLREQYDPEDVNVLYMMTPRSEKHIHGGSRVTDHYRNKGGLVPSLGKDEIAWEVDLDTKLHFLTGSQGTTKLLAKNVKCEVEIL